MRTASTRQLKQNPAQVIAQVLDSGHGVAITAYGRPTGVSLVPDRRTRSRWVKGTDLSGLVPMSPTHAAQLRADLDQMRAA
ncbi:MAG: type II toxin-antitoxin system Phd/YefM family antitoxin [Cellulomonas sp.]|jgi:antitoxin (DNA-binding transcriptional repressor) of toxin-antitoxin stability system|nr:type II toxin-antitoxin system Phd/YefM family antitoxin [Cellulomonas sp.]